MTSAWYALHVKPHKERFVYECLLNPERIPTLATVENPSQLVEAFFPAVRVKPVNPRSAKVRPYFPGYVFVRGDLALVGESAFNWIPGAHGLVRFGDLPAVVPDALIRELREKLTEIEAAGGLVFDALKPGDRVLITTGPFAGYEAIFDMRLPGKERVQVLLSFLSRHPQRVQLEAVDVEKVKKP